MPLSFTNNISPAQSAINSKINPKPLQFSAVPQGNARVNIPSTTNSSTPLGYTQSPSSNTLNAAYGATQNTPIAPANTSSLFTGAAQVPSQPLVTKQNTAQVQNSTVPVTQSSTQQSLAPTQYGQQFTDTQGRTGSALYDSKTGQPLPGNPLSSSGSQASPYTPGGLVGNLLSTSNTAAANINSAAQPTSAYSEALAQWQNDNNAYNKGVNQIQANPIPLEFQQGQKAALQRDYGQRLTADSMALQAAQQEQGFGLTGATSAGQLSTSAAGTAAQIGAPTQVPYSNQLLNPLTGQPINPQSGQSMNDAVALQAEKIKNGTTDPASAASALSAYGQAGTNALQQALGSGFNLNTAAGNANAQANTAAAQGQQVQQFKSSLQQGQNLQSQLGDLITTFGLNPSDINAVNAGLQTIAHNTSSTQYQQLSNYINDIANTYSQILTPPGGSSTDTSRGIAQSMLNSSMSGQGILSVMKGLDNAAQAKIAGVPTLGSPSNSSGSSSTGGWSSLGD